MIRVVVATLTIALTAPASAHGQGDAPPKAPCAGLGLLDAVVVPAFDEKLHFVWVRLVAAP